MKSTVLSNMKVGSIIGLILAVPLFMTMIALEAGTFNKGDGICPYRYVEGFDKKSSEPFCENWFNQGLNEGEIVNGRTCVDEEYLQANDPCITTLLGLSKRDGIDALGVLLAGLYGAIVGGLIGYVVGIIKRYKKTIKQKRRIWMPIVGLNCIYLSFTIWSQIVTPMHYIRVFYISVIFFSAIVAVTLGSTKHLKNKTKYVYLSFIAVCLNIVVDTIRIIWIESFPVFLQSMGTILVFVLITSLIVRAKFVNISPYLTTKNLHTKLHVCALFIGWMIVIFTAEFLFRQNVLLGIALSIWILIPLITFGFYFPLGYILTGLFFDYTIKEIPKINKKYKLFFRGLFIAIYIKVTLWFFQISYQVGSLFEGGLI